MSSDQTFAESNKPVSKDAKQPPQSNPFFNLHHRKSNSLVQTSSESNPLQSLRKGLLMSTVASPVNSGLVLNSKQETTYSAYDGSKVNKIRKGIHHGKAMSLNYQNVDFVKIPESSRFKSLSKIDNKRARGMPDYVKIYSDL